MYHMTESDVSERNDSATPHIDTGKIRGICSGPVRYELIDKDGIPISLKSSERKTFPTATAAAEHARYLWPDQEQDPDRTGRGWDISVAGADR